MKLFYTLPSPYARKCRAALIICGLEDQCEQILVNNMEDESYRKINPLGKVPALVDGDDIYVDSPLICEYIASKQVTDTLYPIEPTQYFRAQQMHVNANGIIDAAVATVMENRRTTEPSIFWLERWQKSIHQALAIISLDELEDTDTPHIGTVATDRKSVV